MPQGCRGRQEGGHLHLVLGQPWRVIPLTSPSCRRGNRHRELKMTAGDAVVRCSLVCGSAEQTLPCRGWRPLRLLVCLPFW